MIFIDLDEHKIYNKFCEGFPHNLKSVKEIINDMFIEYFEESYRYPALRAQMDELWKQISINIPEETVFVIKDAQRYYLTEDLHFETIPEAFLEISNTAHIVLAECFKTCYSNFKEYMGDYKDWEQEESTIPIIRMCNFRDIEVEDVESFFESEQKIFEGILQISLRPKMIEIVSSRIMELYRSVNLDDEPIMIIVNDNINNREVYSVSRKLKIRKISYLYMERQLEEIIGRYVPIDVDFLVNRLYNHILMPSNNIKPYIRIKAVNEKGIDATLFMPDRQIPIVSDFQFGKVYLFTWIKKRNKDRISTYNIGEDTISIESTFPPLGFREMEKLNETMFQDLTCERIEMDGKGGDSERWKLEQGKLTYLEKNIKKPEEEGFYAFFKVEIS